MTLSTVFLGLGSNVEREIHLSCAVKMLDEHLRVIRCSPVFESASVGEIAPPFYNLVVAGETGLALPALIEWLKEIENLHGRRATPCMTKIPLDIDLLLFSDLVGTFGGVALPRPEILERSYVLYPLYLLAPDLVHPTSGVSVGELWQRRKPGPTLKLIGNALHPSELQMAAG